MLERMMRRDMRLPELELRSRFKVLVHAVLAEYNLDGPGGPAAQEGAPILPSSISTWQGKVEGNKVRNSQQPPYLLGLTHHQPSHS